MNAPLHQTTDAFSRALHGVLYGILRWDQLTAFWEKLEPSAGWYLYAIGETVPTEIADGEHVQQFMAMIDALLRQEHQEDYCGIVYADDLDHPSFVKIYDPNHLGSSCGSSKSPTLPGWIMCQMPPNELASSVVPKGRQRWWNNFLASLR